MYSGSFVLIFLRSLAIFRMRCIILKFDRMEINNNNDTIFDETTESDEEPFRQSIVKLDDGKWRIGSVVVNPNEILGHGSCGTKVYAGVIRDDLQNQKVAVKCIDRQRCHANLIREIKALQTLHHPNIIRLYQVLQVKDSVLLVLERCEETLHSALESWTINLDKPSPFADDKNKTQLLLEIANAVGHLHYKSLVHRDLKPQNILLKHDEMLPSKFLTCGQPILGDMGVSKLLQYDWDSQGRVVIHQGADGPSSIVNPGTLGWQAPETMVSRGSSSYCRKFKVDIFSLGCIFYYVQTGSHPFGDGKVREANVMNGTSDISGLDDRLEAYDLVQQMIDHDPRHRPSIQAVIAHPYFWTSEKKIDFVVSISNFLITCRNSHLKYALEQAAPVVFDQDWMKILDKSLVKWANDKMLKFGSSYDRTSLESLVRFIRNCDSHVAEMPPQVKRGFASGGKCQYFCKKFPKLLMTCFWWVQIYHPNDKDIWAKHLCIEFRQGTCTKRACDKAHPTVADLTHFGDYQDSVLTNAWVMMKEEPPICPRLCTKNAYCNLDSTECPFKHNCRPPPEPLPEPISTAAVRSDSIRSPEPTPFHQDSRTLSSAEGEPAPYHQDSRTLSSAEGSVRSYNYPSSEGSIQSPEPTPYHQDSRTLSSAEGSVRSYNYPSSEGSIQSPEPTPYHQEPRSAEGLVQSGSIRSLAEPTPYHHHPHQTYGSGPNAIQPRPMSQGYRPASTHPMYANPMYKTQMCNFFVRGLCRKGRNCDYIHETNVAPPKPFKKVRCKHEVECRQCPKGQAACGFIHRGERGWYEGPL